MEQEYFSTNKQRISIFVALLILAWSSIQLFIPGKEALAQQGNVYYVAPTGNDSNPGTETQPWQTIQKAANTLTSGEIVYIRAGIYRERVIPQNSGNDSNHYITYAAYPGETVTLDGNGISVPADTGLIYVSRRNYIRISGLRVINSGYAGILVGDSGHIILEKNYTDNTASSGIGVWGSNNIIIDGNEIERACSNGMQEFLTMAGTDTFEIKNNRVHNGVGEYRKEGIDAKDGSSNGKVYGNHVYSIQPVGIYVEAWDKHTFNIDVFQNTVYDVSGMGISLASEQGGLLEHIRVYNNIAYHNKFVGIWLSSCCPEVTSHPMRDIKIINNTSYNNGWETWGGGIGVENSDIQNVVIRNNIVSQNLYFQIAADASKVTIDHNLIDGFRGAENEIYGEEPVKGNPLFMNASEADFHLQPDSPAIDRGSSADAPTDDFEGNPRPQDGNEDNIAAFDIGAYEVKNFGEVIRRTFIVRVLLSSLPADGLSTATVTATLIDASGRPVIGENVRMVISTGQGKIGSVKDNGDGTYAATYTASKQPGVETITITAAGVSKTVDITLTEIQVSRKLIIQEVTAAPGDTVTAPISITDAAGVAGGDFTVAYDKNMLTATDAKTTTLSAGMNLEFNPGTPGEIILTMAKLEGITGGSGPLIDMIFKVNANTVVGTETPLVFKSAVVFNALGDRIPMGTQNGKVIIGPCVKGDVNRDGSIMSSDAILALRIAAKLLVPTAYQECAADINSDGDINSSDAIRILRKTAGLPAPPGMGIAMNPSSEVTVSLAEAHGLVGKDVAVPVKVDNISILAGGDISVCYDPSVLRAVGVSSNAGVLLESNVSEPGVVFMSFANADGLNSGNLAEIKFQVLADGVSLLKLQMAKLYNPDALPLSSRRIDREFRSWAMPAEHSALLQNFPNPFNPETWIPFQLKEGSDIKIRIYSSVGELVRELDLGYKPAGYYVTQDRAAYWDGKDRFGSEVSSGMYFYSIQAQAPESPRTRGLASVPSFSAVRKLIVLR